jgi:hypothetical protein
MTFPRFAVTSPHNTATVAKICGSRRTPLDRFTFDYAGFPRHVICQLSAIVAFFWLALSIFATKILENIY